MQRLYTLALNASPLTGLPGNNSIAGIDLRHRRYSSFLEVNDACAEMKMLAKSTAGSTVCFDQRKDH